MKTKAKRKPRGVRLNSPQSVRRLLSRLINQCIRGEINTDLLRAITYASSMILKSLELAELSDRLERIEKELKI